MSIPLISRVRQIGPRGGLLLALLDDERERRRSDCAAGAAGAGRQPPLPHPRRCR